MLATSAAVGLLGYYSAQAVLVPVALERVDTRVRAGAADLDTYLSSVRSDALALQSLPTHDGIVRARLSGGIDLEEGLTEAKWRERLEAVYVGQLRAKPAFAQLRFISAADGGREIVRVDRSGANGKIRVVPDAELQRKGDRDYVRQSIGLPPGVVYVSPIELNREHGIVETPHVPVLRFAATVQALDGKPFGIVIINLDMRPVFASCAHRWVGTPHPSRQRAGRLSAASRHRARIRLRSRPAPSLAGRIPRARRGLRLGRKRRCSRATMRAGRGLLPGWRRWRCRKAFAVRIIETVSYAEDHGARDRRPPNPA